MNSSDETWTDVAEHLRHLGSLLSDQLRADVRQERSPDESDTELREALQTIGENVKAAFGAFGDAVMDPSIHEEAKRTAAVFFDALGTTFSELGDDISQRLEDEDSPNPLPSDQPVRLVVLEDDN